MRYLFIYLLYLFGISESINQNTLINVNNVIYPNSTLFSHNIIRDYNYNLQYYNNTWLDNQINYTIDKNINYNELYNFKEYKLRYKFIDRENENLYYSNNFTIAYINASYTINDLNNEILLKWNNINFIGNNSLYLNYYYHNKIYKYENFNEININNIHIIDLNDILKKLFVLNFTFVIKNNDYNIKEYIHFDHNNLTRILTNKTHTSKSYCLINYCKNNLGKEAEICINNKIYKSFCHAFCYNENFNSIKSFSDLKKCNSTLNKVIPNQTYNTISSTPTTQFNNIGLSVNKIIFPYNNSFKITGISSNFSYILQYFDNIWYNTKYTNNIDKPFNIIYNDLLKFKNYTLRYKLIDDNIIVFSNNFNIAYIDLEYKVNKINKTIDIDWKNINFISNNTLLIDYYYSNKTNIAPKLIEENIDNNHNIDIMKYLEKYILYKVKFLIKSNEYNITKYIDISHDYLVKMVYNNSYSRYKLCVEKYCKKMNDKKHEVCINNKKYKSACHLICNNEYFESLDEIKKCDNNLESTIQPTLLPKTILPSTFDPLKKLTQSTITSTTIDLITKTIITPTTTQEKYTPTTTQEEYTPTTTQEDLSITPTTTDKDLLITPTKITTTNQTFTSQRFLKTPIKYNNKLDNYELIFTGIQSCNNNKRCNNAKRFSTAKDNDHTKHLLNNNDLMVETCLIFCDNHINCKGVYIFYGLDNNFKCRTLTNLGNSNGSNTILYDYSYKYIGNREILSTPTTTETQTLTTTLTITETQTLTTTPTKTETQTLTTKLTITDTQTLSKSLINNHIVSKLNNSKNNNLNHKNKDSKSPKYILYALIIIGILFLFCIMLILSKRKKKTKNFKEKVESYYNNLERPNFSNAIEINNYSKLNKNKEDPNYRTYNNQIYESNIKYNVETDKDNNMENNITFDKDLNTTTEF